MRIQTLHLKNFRSHEQTVLELDRFNFIRGPNGCGKSSIQMALEYLFTGRCLLTDAAGRGAEALIRLGEKELAVSAILESGETICRRRTSRSQIVEINGMRVPADTAGPFFAQHFGSADVLSAVLNADHFVDLPDADQQTFLVQLLDAGKITIPGEISEALRAIGEQPPELTSVSDVEAAHRRFYDLRTEAGRALKALGQMEKPNLLSDSPSAQDLRNKLQELRQQKERLIAQKAGADTCWQNTQARLGQVQSEIEDASSEMLSPDEEQELLQLESQRDRAEKVRHDLAELTVEQRTVEKSLNAVQIMKGRCPTCWQPISEAAKAKEVERLRARLSGLEGLIQGAREELNEFDDLEAVTPRLEAHRRALAKRAKLFEERSQIQAAQRPDAADIESRIVILTERINKGERILDKAQQSEMAKERWETYVRDKSALEMRIGLLERLTEFFGPNGVMIEQASDRLEPFQEKLNRQLAVFGWTCNLTLEPFDIRISSAHGAPDLPLEQLSESERFRFGVAFQLALATATGIRFVVMDRADVLDRDRRKLLTALLLNSDAEQAVVLATGEELPPPMVPQGVKFLALAEPLKLDESFESPVAPSASEDHDSAIN